MNLDLPAWRHDGPGVLRAWPAKRPNRAATSCPARHGSGRPGPGLNTPHWNPAINPMSLEPGARPADHGAARATTPCPAAAAVAPPPISPNPDINPMSREPSP